METFSASLAFCAGNSPVTGEFPAQRPVTQSFDVIFDLRLNKRLREQWWGWWFETPSRSFWRQCNVSAKKFGRHSSDTAAEPSAKFQRYGHFKAQSSRLSGAYNNTSYRILKKVRVWDHFTWPPQPTSSYQLINRIIEGLFNGTDFQSPTNGNIYSVTLP